MSRAAERADKYSTLVQENPQRADAYLSRLLAEKGLGLPDTMEDPTDKKRYVSGQQVLEGAAVYMTQRGGDREERLGLDPAKAAKTKMRCMNLIEDTRCTWRSNWASGNKPYNMDHLMKACNKVKVWKRTAGLPNAAVKYIYGNHAKLLLASQNRCKFVMVIPQQWKRQPTFHKLKQGKKNALAYASYRTLSTNHVELRIAEELWAQFDEDAAWAAAGDTHKAAAQIHCT